MFDKKTLYSFLATIAIITIAYSAVAADNNNRASGFGGVMPAYSSMAQELIYSNDVTVYLYENSADIAAKVKRTLSPEGMLLMTFGERAADGLKKLCQIS